MKILLDMDNTMNRLWENYIVYLNDIYKTNFSCTREDMQSYGLANNLKLPERFDDPDTLRQRVFQTPGFWTSIEIFDEYTKPVVEEMYKKHDVYICTTPWHDYTECCSEKIMWVRKHLPFFDIDKMIFIKNKSMVRADLIIDDAPENLENMPFNKIIMDFPYNRNIGGLRVFGWKEVYEMMRENFYV